MTTPLLVLVMTFLCLYLIVVVRANRGSTWHVNLGGSESKSFSSNVASLMSENYIAKNDKQLYQLDASEVQILPNAKPFDIVTSSEDTMVISRDNEDDPPRAWTPASTRGKLFSFPAVGKGAGDSTLHLRCANDAPEVGGTISQVGFYFFGSFSFLYLCITQHSINLKILLY